MRLIWLLNFISVFCFAFSSCNTIDYTHIDQETTQFTYDYPSSSVTEEINRVMSQKCFVNSWSILNTEVKTIQKSFNWVYTSYETTSTTGKIGNANVNLTSSTPKTNVVPINYSESYYVTTVQCDYDYDDDDDDDDSTDIIKEDTTIITEDTSEDASLENISIDTKEDIEDSIMDDYYNGY